MDLQSATQATTSARNAQRRHRADALRAQIGRQARRLSLAVAGGLLDGVSAGVRRLSPTSRYAVSDGMIWALGPLLRRARTAAEANFVRVVGQSEASAAAQRSLRNYGRMAMDFLASRTMAPEEILALVEPRGEEHFRAALAHGHGAIFALPHAGCWDVAAVFAQAYGCQLTVVTESDWATELVAGSRRTNGVTLAPRDQSLRSLFRALRRQECVVMLSDLTPPGVQSAEVPFFGAPARFPLGPARLALATGAPVLVVMSVRTPDNRFIVAAQPPLIPARPAHAARSARAAAAAAAPRQPNQAPDRQDAHDAEASAIAMTAEVAAGFERIIRAYPDQWYPYHPVWESTAPKSATKPADERDLASPMSPLSAS